MRRLSFTVAVAAITLFAVSGQASAADLPSEQGEGTYQSAPLNPYHQWYVRGDIGVGIFDGLGDDDALTFGFGMGRRWSDNFRSDITFDYVGEYDLNNGTNDVDAVTVLANGYVDFNLSSFMNPYVGAGLGYGDVEARVGGIKDNDDGLAYAVHAGVAVDVTERTLLDLSYRYRGIDVSGPDFEDHSFQAGFRFKF